MKTRKYFEAFGDLEEEIRFLRILPLWLGFGFIAILLLFYQYGNRPPVVIRVDEVKGTQVIEDLNQNNAPASFEMTSFAKRFVMRYTAYNSYTISRDLAEAMNQMSSKLQKETRRKLIDSGLVSKIAEAKIAT